MADNLNLPLTGSGDATAVQRTKDHGGVETVIVGLDLNPNGAESLMAGYMPVQGNYVTGTLQSAATTTGNGSTLDVTGMGAVVFTFSGTAGTYTINFEASPDNSDWSALFAQQLGTNLRGQVSNQLSSTNSFGPSMIANCAGFRYVRARISTVSAGNVTVTAVAAAAAPLATLLFDLANNPDAKGPPFAHTFGSLNYLWNSTSSVWERARTASADGIAAVTGIPGTATFLWNGATFDRWKSLNGIGDAATVGAGPVGLMAYNGSAWDRVRLTASQGNLKTDISTVAGTTADTNSGNKSGGTLRVVLATDQPALTTAMPVSLASGATAIAKAEDVASANADVGVPAMAVRKATPANTSDTDGDYEMLQVSAGRLWASSDLTLAGTAVDGNSGNKSAGTVRVVLATDQPQLTNALKVDPSAVTSPVSLAAGAATIGKAEDAASADADVGVPAMAVRKATPANTSGTDGDYEMLQMAAGRLWTSSDITLAGTAADGNSGNKSGATLRVVLATDQPALTNAQPSNVTQVAGTTLDVNSGNKSAGTQRVVVATDQPAFAVIPNDNVGRTHINFYAIGVASGTTTTETAISLTKSSGTASTSAAASWVITSGKKYRITSITFATRGNATATAQITTFNLRINTAGAVITSSTPVVLSARCATPATTLAWDRFSVPIPDGFEITGDGTLQFGVTANAVFVTNAPTWDVLITGFEY